MQEAIGKMMKARRAFLAAQPRSFPDFIPGMSTAIYICAYSDKNCFDRAPRAREANLVDAADRGGKDLRRVAYVLPYDLDAYRRPAPVEQSETFDHLA